VEILAPPTVIVLAAGRGERFAASGGAGSKLHALLGGQRVIDWTLQAVRGSGLPFHVQEGAHAGMGDSIAAAVHATCDASGWLILPADLPLVQPATLRAVAAALQHAPAAYPLHAGQRGHPVGFGRACAEALMSLEGNRGAAGVLSAREAIKLIVNDIGCVTDIDTVQDLHNAQALLENMPTEALAYSRQAVR
jgi:molybdenum cofactor cytidylyltransferase